VWCQVSASISYFLPDIFGAGFFAFLAVSLARDFAVFFGGLVDLDCLAVLLAFFFGADFFAAPFWTAFLTVFFGAVSTAGAFEFRVLAAATRLLAR
jgi:hypothetical protein